MSAQTKQHRKAVAKLARRLTSYEETMRTWKGHPGAFTKPGSMKLY